MVILDASQMPDQPGDGVRVWVGAVRRLLVAHCGADLPDVVPNPREGVTQDFPGRLVTDVSVHLVLLSAYDAGFVRPATANHAGAVAALPLPDGVTTPSPATRPANRASHTRRQAGRTASPMVSAAVRQDAMRRTVTLR